MLSHSRATSFFALIKSLKIVPKFFVVKFVMRVLEKLPLCEKIPHEESYLNILNDTKILTISDVWLCGFSKVHGYLINFGDANFTVLSPVHKKSKCGVSRLPLIVYEKSILLFLC